MVDLLTGRPQCSGCLKHPAYAMSQAPTMSRCMPAQVDQLADMISTVFMVHSASQLDVFDQLNTSHAITAAELAVDLFWNQVDPLHHTAPATCMAVHIPADFIGGMRATPGSELSYTALRSYLASVHREQAGSGD